MFHNNAIDFLVYLEFEIPMPEYLQEVLNHKPTYNIDTTKHIKEIDYEKLTHDAITAALNQKLPVPDDGKFASMFLLH